MTRNLSDTEIERQIGERVRIARREFKLSQSKLAPLLGLTRDQLASVETGRVALRFGVGWALCLELDLNPLWLLGSENDRRGFVDLPGFGNAWKDRLFSIAMWMNLAQPDEEWPGYSRYRTETLKARRSVGPNVIPQLTSMPDAINLPPMKLQGESLWPKLRDELRAMVSQRGSKAALARAVGLTRQAINAMLRQKNPYVPSAEYTLRLRQWAKAAEAHQKKRAGVTAPALTTQTKESKYEKNPSSDRKKK